MIIVTIWIGDDTEKKEFMELAVRADEGVDIESVTEEVTAAMLEWLSSKTRLPGASMSFRKG